MNRLTAVSIALLMVGSPAAAISDEQAGKTQQTQGAAQSGERTDRTQSPRQRAERQPAQQGSRMQQGSQSADTMARQGRERNGPSVDRLVEQYVLLRLAEHEWVGGDFRVSAQDGKVTLEGTVPSEAAKRRMTRLARNSVGVADVENRMTVRPRSAEATSPVDDRELSRRVAEQIANEIRGAKAGKDWWFTGWRVEGPDNDWRFTVHSDAGTVSLEGDVPRLEIMRKAVDVARNVDGVMSVESHFEIERYFARYGYPRYGDRRYPYPGYPHPGPYGPYGYAPYWYGPYAGPERDAPAASPGGDRDGGRPRNGQQRQ